ncbi:MAG: HU family DNA-binding protein [Candidatus Methanofastidiosum sp.]|nr:HU family DNA-binding protein [Methanofastidiosum sp.]
MNKAELIDVIAKKSGFTKKDSEKFLNTFIEVIFDAARKGESVRLPRFGTFKVVTRKERTARNPRTGELVKVPQTKLLRFSPSLELRSL